MKTITKPMSTIEKVSAMIEEQSLTKDELIGYLRQVMEIRALEDNIANLIRQSSTKRRFTLICRARGRGGGCRLGVARR